MNRELVAYRAWSIIGWAALLAVIVLSLVRIEQPLALDHADKYQHVLAYGFLMYWWGMVQPARKHSWMIALPVLGFLLELAQMLTTYRNMDWRDGIANLLGVALAVLLLATPARRLLALIDDKLANRRNSRRP